MRAREPSRQDVDCQLFELLDCLAEYQQLRSSSGGLLRQAFFDLALAKRAAGYRWISPDLYSGRARANSTVAIDETTSPNDMQVVRGSVGRVEHTSETSECDFVRRRRGRGSQGSDQAEIPEDDDEKPTEPEPAAANDPLLWFGMLTPPQLKDAQRGFASSLDQLVRLAQLTRIMAAKQQDIQAALAALSVPNAS